MIGVRRGARAAGADPDITQNGVAANTFAIANAMGASGTGGTHVVGAGAAGGSGRPTAPVTLPANVRAALAGDVGDRPPPPPPPEIIPPAVVDPPPPPAIIPPAGSTSANTAPSHSRSSTGATAGSSSSRSTVGFKQARVLFFHSKRK